MTVPGAGDVGEYIAAAPPAARRTLEELRALIREVAPDAGERMSYGMPYYELNGRFAYFSLHSRHIGLYPAPREDAEACGLAENLTAKSTLRFALDQPLPLSSVRQFLQRRAAQMRAQPPGAEKPA